MEEFTPQDPLGILSPPPALEQPSPSPAGEYQADPVGVGGSKEEPSTAPGLGDLSPNSGTDVSPGSASLQSRSLLGYVRDQEEKRLQPENIIDLSNTRATRNLPITDQLRSNIQGAVSSVYGHGYRAQVYSGGQPEIGSGGKRVGSTRHDGGHAADVYIIGPDGKRVTGDGLAPLAKHWISNGFGGVGLEMKGGGIHLDTHTDRAPVWSYGVLTNGQQAAIKEGLGLRGNLPSATKIARADTDYKATIAARPSSEDGAKKGGVSSTLTARIAPETPKRAAGEIPPKAISASQAGAPVERYSASSEINEPRRETAIGLLAQLSKPQQSPPGLSVGTPRPQNASPNALSLAGDADVAIEVADIDRKIADLQRTAHNNPEAAALLSALHQHRASLQLAG